MSYNAGMWKVSLALIGHRLLLLVVALLAINVHLASLAPANAGPRLLPTATLWTGFVQRVHEGQEFQEMEKLSAVSPKEIFRATRNPFLWATRWLMSLTGMRSQTALLLLSNLFLILFLSELVALLNRMGTPDVAEGAAMLMVLWPTSFEMSLGDSSALMAFLVTLIVRQAIDNRWLIAGLALFFLGLMDPIVLGLLPMLIYFFWFFQRHYQVQQVLKRTAFFLIPLGCALYLRWHEYPSVGSIFSGSALGDIMAWAKQPAAARASLSRSFSGQLVTVVFFAIGAGVSLLSNSGLMYRLVPLNQFVVWLFFTPYAQVASRAPLAAVCLGGIASATSQKVMRGICAVLLFLSAYEAFLTFSVA